ncbi:MAG: outer membrane lipoprotein carrier protein LolA [Sterolibacterium sp.]|nr:outer membrane lipoprotein carrier protein LolA [Sterolibacterium sp.]
MAVLSLFGLSGHVHAASLTTDELAARMAQRFEQTPVIRAEFMQEKAMAAFKKPLMTRGRLVFARGQGVIWKIEAPLRLTYVLGEDRITEMGEDGVAQVRTAQDVPGLAQVGRVFRALLGAQTEALRELFTIAPEGSVDAWRLQLTPKPGPLAQAIKKIQLAGGRHVERIRIEEGNGDATTIAFSHTSEDRMLTSAEREAFGVR